MRIRPLILALAGALAVLAFSSGSPATPVFAASSLTSHRTAPPGQAAATPAQLEALIAKSPAATRTQLAAARAYLLAHPFQGTVQGGESVSGPSSGPRGIQPNLSIGTYWWGFQIYLTNADVTSLFTAIVTYGTAAVAAALCAPGVWLVVLCGAVGTLIGWAVVTVVLQVTYNFGGCAVIINIDWWGHWSWYCV